MNKHANQRPRRLAVAIVAMLAALFAAVPGAVAGDELAIDEQAADLHRRTPGSPPAPQQQGGEAARGGQSQPAKSDPRELESVVVVGVRAAIFGARAQERATPTITNVVTSDGVGQFADQNVAESLQRVPGLAIDRDAGEGRRINVRGLGPLFNPVSVNGMRLGTSDLDRDAVVDVLPNDLLGTIIVHKTLTPDMNADAIGGAVDLKAIDPFERAGGGTARIEGSRQRYSGSRDPKFNASWVDATELAGTGRLGVSLALSYNERELNGDVVRNRGLISYSRVGAACAQPTEPGCFLRSERVENRVDYSERRRLGFAANIDLQASDDHEFFLRLIDSRFDRDDVRFNDRWQMGATAATAIGPGTATFRNAELRKQISFIEINERTWMSQLGGASDWGPWRLDWFIGASENDFETPRELTGRFRVRNIFVDVVQTPNVSYVSGRPGTAANSNPANPAHYFFDQLTLVQQERRDELRSLAFDVTREVDFGAFPGSFKFGMRLDRRDKLVDRNERVGNTQGAPGVGTVTLASLGLFTPRTRIPFYGFQPRPNEALGLFEGARSVLGASDFNSAAEDFFVAEDVDAAYLMATLEWSERLRIFGGVRVERTQWNTSGKELETLDPLVGANVFTVRPITAPENTYTDWLPSLHLRWDAREDLVLRSSITTALIRPNFDEGAATRQVSTNEILGAPGTYRRTIVGGNPQLDPLKALQFDLSLAWYPDDSTFVYGGVFFKRIDDFFVEGVFEGADVARLGLPVGNGTINGGFDSVLVFLNGDRANVRGVELSFEKSLVELPGFWGGLFVAGNLTVQHSESKVPLLRPGETLPLIDQPDRIANLSLGWENERFTFRVAANYRDEQVDVYASQPFLDEILAPWFSYDVNMRWNIGSNWQIYLDAVNLDARKDATRYRGDANGTFASDEAVNDFGPSYALGVRYRF